MAVVKFECSICLKDLSDSPKERVIIRNRSKEYSCLIDMVTQLLKEAGKDHQCYNLHDIHEKLHCRWSTL